jgi:hypothetical protein
MNEKSTEEKYKDLIGLIKVKIQSKRSAIEIRTKRSWEAEKERMSLVVSVIEQLNQEDENQIEELESLLTFVGEDLPAES